MLCSCSAVLGGPREVTPSVMKSSTGLEGIRSFNVSTLVMKATDDVLFLVIFQKSQLLHLLFPLESMKFYILSIPCN